MVQVAPAIDPRLLEDIRGGNCVAFVGAGFSAAAGLPAWPQLVREMAAAAPADLGEQRVTLQQLLGSGRSYRSHRELEMAAQLLYDALGEARFREQLRARLQARELPEAMALRLKHLLGIPFRAIVTTNFDPLLPGVPPDAIAYRRLLRTDRFGPWREPILRAALDLDGSRQMADAPDRPVVQLHGTLLHDATLVFTRSQYRRRLYANPAYLTALKALLATSTVLFLGYSMRDAYLNELRAELVEAFHAEDAALQADDPRLPDLGRPLAWAVLEDVSDVACSYYERHEGLGVVPYRTGGHGRDHGEFDAILAEIYGRTNPVHHLGQLLQRRRLLWLDHSPERDALGRRLLTAAVREATGTTRAVDQHLVEAMNVEHAIAMLGEGHAFDLVLCDWRGGPGLPEGSTGAALLRAVAARRAQGEPTAPVLVFATDGAGSQARRCALELGALGFTADWAELMTMVEHALATT
jgi:CheY-like chemotaxis protein